MRRHLEAWEKGRWVKEENGKKSNLFGLNPNHIPPFPVFVTFVSMQLTLLPRSWKQQVPLNIDTYLPDCMVSHPRRLMLTLMAVRTSDSTVCLVILCLDKE